jgi:hypothetical protein
MPTHHADLITSLGRLEAHRANLRAARERLMAHVRERLDDVNRTLGAVEQARGEDPDSGGILTHRRHETLLNERERLNAILRDHEIRKAELASA